MAAEAGVKACRMLVYSGALCQWIAALRFPFISSLCAHVLSRTVYRMVRLSMSKQGRHSHTRQVTPR